MYVGNINVTVDKTELVRVLEAMQAGIELTISMLKEGKNEIESRKD